MAYTLNMLNSLHRMDWLKLSSFERNISFMTMQALYLMIISSTEMSLSLLHNALQEAEENQKAYVFGY